MLLSHQQHICMPVSPEVLQFDSNSGFQPENSECPIFKTSVPLMEVLRRQSAAKEGLGLRKGRRVFEGVLRGKEFFHSVLSFL